MSLSVAKKAAPTPHARRKKPSVCPEESQEQRNLFEWWRLYSLHTPHLVMYHIPNGGKRDAVTGARLKGQGVVAGVPDIFLAASRQGFHGLYIELKRQKGGRVEKPQKDIIARLREAGYRVEVCKGWQAAREVIENYLTGALPQGKELCANG